MGKHKKVNIGDRFGKLVVVQYNGVKRKSLEQLLGYICASAIVANTQLL